MYSVEKLGGAWVRGQTNYSNPTFFNIYKEKAGKLEVV